MLAAGAQKYLLGIPGIAFLYVRPELAQRLTPTVTGWFGRVNPFAFDPQRPGFRARRGALQHRHAAHDVRQRGARQHATAQRDRHCPPIEAYLAQLSDVALEEAGAWASSVASPANPRAKGANTAIRVPNAAQVEAQMLEGGYVVSARNDVIRIAPHFYNTAEDVTGALRALARLVL